MDRVATALSALSSDPGRPAAEVGAALVDNVGAVVLGKPEAIRLAVAGVLAGGHLLLEDAPGVGKTVFAKALARSLGGRFGRVQGTADLLPTDLTGVTIHEPAEGWVFHPGPLFNHVVLVDEINRATPRAQSALLEAMAERQVTADDATHPLPDPFVVIATQNPSGDLGTFPLVAGQRDRFAVTLSLGFAGRHAERALLLGDGGEAALVALPACTSPSEIVQAQLEVDRLHVASSVADYVLDLADATRAHAAVQYGASTRAALVLLRVAKALAVLAGRDFVGPDEVQEAAGPVLAHRLGVRSGSASSAAAVVEEVIARVAVPVSA